MNRPLCSFAWTDDRERSGSNHICGLEKGHVGVHECISCHASVELAPPGPVTNDGNHFVERIKA